MQSIYDVSTIGRVFGVGEGSLGDLYAAGISPGGFFGPAEDKGQSKTLGTGFEIRKVEVKEIMPFDHIGVPFLDRRKHAFQHVLFGMFFTGPFLPRYDMAISLVIREGNDDDAVAFSVSVGELKIGITVDFTPISWGSLVEKLGDSLEWDCHLISLGGGLEPNGGSNVWNPKATVNCLKKMTEEVLHSSSVSRNHELKRSAQIIQVEKG